MPNANLKYRPLRSGIEIYNPKVDQEGSLGLILTDGQDRFILSAYHVLCSDSNLIDCDPIYQPTPDPNCLVAHVTLNYCDQNIDYGVAKMVQAISSVREVLELGAISNTPAAPAEGMRVCKFGITTRLTEGKIVCPATNDLITIKPLDDYPPDYNLSSIGDSGSVWIEQETGKPVAIHKSGDDNNGSTAFAIPLTTILNNTGLSIN